MTSEELKTAMIHEQPVECDGIKYRFVNAIILARSEKGKPKLQAVLMDMNCNSVTTVDPRKVKLVGELSSFSGKALGGAVLNEDNQ